MGNRISACGLFGDGREPSDRFQVDGLSEEENLLLKEMYLSMDISSMIALLNIIIRKRNYDI